MVVKRGIRIRVPMPGGKIEEIALPALPRSGRYPSWFKQRIRTFLKAKRGEEWTVFCGAAQRPWLDHWGVVRYDGRECFVSEPYGLTLDDLEALARFCRTMNLEMNLSALGAHFPTQESHLKTIISILQE